MRCAKRLSVFAAVMLGFASAPAGDEPVKRQLQELNNLTGAESIHAKMRELLKQPDAVKKLVEAALPLAKDKDKLTYHSALMLAQLAGELKDLKSSEAFFRRCMEEGARLQSTRKLLESYGGLIDLFYENKMYAESVRVCRELLDLQTDDGKPRQVIIPITNRFGDVDFIEDDRFDTTGRLKPSVHRLLIQAVTKQGKFDQAIKLVDNLIKASDHWQERQLKAWVQREAGNVEESANLYEDVLERIAKDKDLEDEDRDLYQERYHYVLSNVYVDLKKIDRATEHLQWLLKKKPEEPGYNNDLGYIWADHDMKLDEAEQLIRKALDGDRARRQKKGLKGDDDRDNGAYLDSLGWVLFKKKQYKEAKEILLKAVQDKAAQHIEIYDHLGDVHLVLGEKSAALAAWRKGLEVVGEGRRELERKTSVEKKIEMHSK